MTDYASPSGSATNVPVRLGDQIALDVTSSTSANTARTCSFTIAALGNFTRGFQATTSQAPAWQTAASLGNFVAGASFNQALSATDPESDTVTYAAVSGVPGTLGVSGSSLTGTVPAGGTYSFTLRATDSHGASADRTFDLFSNGQPTFSSPTNGTDLGTFAQFHPMSVNLTASDPNGGNITYIIVNAPSPSASWKLNGQSGSITVASGTTVTLTGYSEATPGSQLLRLRVSDNGGFSNSTQTIDVTYTTRYPLNCKEINTDQPTLGTAFYSIKPASTVVSARCDMGSDGEGAGWTLLNPNLATVSGASFDSVGNVYGGLVGTSGCGFANRQVQFTLSNIAVSFTQFYATLNRGSTVLQCTDLDNGTASIASTRLVYSVGAGGYVTMSGGSTAMCTWGSAEWSNAFPDSSTTGRPSIFRIRGGSTSQIKYSSNCSGTYDSGTYNWTFYVR